MKRRIGSRTRVSLAALFVVTAAMLVGGAVSLANTPLPHAAFTTTNTTVDGTGHCQNGNEAVNCNIYDGKDFVWLNGGPVAASLSDGDYFFAVLVPGGQGGNENPNDGTTANLSDLSPTSGTGAGDAWTNRVFTVSNGTVSYAGTHDFDSNEIRLMPYDDTTNPGGVYILAICSLADASSLDGTNGPAPGVDPSDCKYDAFKVNGENVTPDAQNPTVTKDAEGAFDKTYEWNIAKSADKTQVEQVGGTVQITYTVHVTHTAGSVSNVVVTGGIQVFNPNTDDQNNTVPVDITGVTDQLSDGTDCTVSGGSTTLSSFETDFTYECDLTGLPQAQLDNTVTVSWDSQLLDNGSFLAAGSDDFTFSNVKFAENTIDGCTDLTDPVPAGGTSNDNPFPTTVCVGDAGDGGAGTGTTDGFTFTYHVTYTVKAGCVDYTNTATETPLVADPKSSSVTVTICGPLKTSALTIGFWKNTNGQALIGTYCAPSGKTSLATYLSSLGAGSGPFSDAAGKTCSQLKTYVTNVLKGASATNMNVMLRAQMLGTALDVYFSDPNLGYTATTVSKVKPPSNFLTNGPLGGVNIDTTAICPMIDNTTAGTATCKNNTPSTDGYLSGALPAACMTVQAILNYESTVPSPFNGSTSAPNWYAGNRTKEEIAKNTFDQINNQDAFGC